MNEFELIARYFSRTSDRPAGRDDIVLGVGDDGALWDADATVAIATDMLVGGRHFFDDVDPRALGHKVLAVNLSDLAAMGAAPRACTLALALPDVDAGWLEALSGGLYALADRYGCALVGGDTTRGPLNLCLTALGTVPRDRALRRDAAVAGDELWLSGRIGAAAFAVAARARGLRLAHDHPARVRLDWPQPRVELGLGLRGLSACAIDVSDGLAGDLAHIAERSRCGARIDWERLPLDPVLADCADDAERRALALGGGDDYELLFTAPRRHRARIESLGARLGLELTRIGVVTADAGLLLLRRGGRTEQLQATGFDHFAAPAAGTQAEP